MSAETSERQASVDRRMEEAAPVAVYYSLTPKGKELLDVLDDWAGGGTTRRGGGRVTPGSRRRSERGSYSFRNTRIVSRSVGSRISWASPSSEKTAFQLR